MDTYHISVLLDEAVDALQVHTGKQYIDATLGGGGHTRLILEQGGIVLGIDQDQDAIDHVLESFAKQIEKKTLQVVKGNFRDIDTIAKDAGLGVIDGILLDIGISSHHVDSAERGFSFQSAGPLDMRMDTAGQLTAADLINSLTKGELYDLFTKLGEERFSRSIVANIISARAIKPIQTTEELATLVKRSVPFSKKGVHPATRVFQALRIAVNDELRSLQEALPHAMQLLAPGGRLAVISFHSLEDRIIKQIFREYEDKGFGRRITKKPIVPSEEEIQKNSRARSAKLRVWEKK